MVAIGVTDRIDFDELTLIASTPCDVHTVDYFDQMDSDMNATMNFICGCESVKQRDVSMRDYMYNVADMTSMIHSTVSSFTTQYH